MRRVAEGAGLRKRCGFGFPAEAEGWSDEFRRFRFISLRRAGPAKAAKAPFGPGESGSW
jgi:hypothetical protein